MCVSNVSVNLFKVWNHFIAMRAAIKAHETADSKTNVKACLLKHMVTKTKPFIIKRKVLPVNTA